MNVEQLQAIKERASRWDKSGLTTLHLVENDVPTLITEVERLQELLKGNDGMSVLEIREQFVHLHRQLLEEQGKSNEYREALEFYADEKNHTEPRGNRIFGDVFYVKGKIARKALAGEPNE
ncbi:hypothetical protein [Lysinibacillus sp. LZ02]|uniref:hypothetical protein n=1 Tax=Lysinibacillus sp. LZ02 TaxID=3420668 RepID=UPI003D36006D